MTIKKYEKIFDANTGTSNAFIFKDNTLSFKVVVVGTPGANIQFWVSRTRRDHAYVKANCTSWAGASLKLQAKTETTGDDYSDTGDVFTADSVRRYRYGRGN